MPSPGHVGIKVYTLYDFGKCGIKSHTFNYRRERRIMSHGKEKLYLIGLCHLLLIVSVTSLASAQGTVEDYQRAQRFLPGNVRQIAYVANVTPNWIEKTNRFWYLKASPPG